MLPKSVRIASDAHKGRKVIATEPIDAGTTILQERAYAITIPEEEYENLQALLPPTRQCLVNNQPNWAVAVLKETPMEALTSCSEKCDFSSAKYDYHKLLCLQQRHEPTDKLFMPLKVSTALKSLPEALQSVDSIKSQIADLIRIFRANHFSMFLLSEDGSSTTVHSRPNGLFLYASLFNHSCHHNTVHTFEGDEITLRTLRRVEASEELTLNYGITADFSSTRTERQSLLLYKFSFECACDTCCGNNSIESQLDEDRELYTTLLRENNFLILLQLYENVFSKNSYQYLCMLRKALLCTFQSKITSQENTHTWLKDLVELSVLFYEHSMARKLFCAAFGSNALILFDTAVDCTTKED